MNWIQKLFGKKETLVQKKEFYLINREVNNIDEATFYLLHGAFVKSFRTRKLNPKRANHLGHRDQHVLFMESISTKQIGLWNERKAQVNIREYMERRLKLKEQVGIKRK